MDFDDYQRTFNALFAADYALDRVCSYPNDPPAVEFGTVEAFQLLRMALSQCVDRLGLECLRRCPESDTPDVGALLEHQRNDGFTMAAPLRDLLVRRTVPQPTADHATAPANEDWVMHELRREDDAPAF